MPLRTQSLVRRATPFLGIAAVFAVATATSAPELLAFPLFLIVVISSALFDNRAQLLAVGGVATLAILVLSVIHLGQTSNLATAVFEVAVLAIVAGSVHEVVQHVRAAEGSAEKKATDLETDDARLHMVMEAATIGLGVATADGRWLQVNERLGTILGLGRGELMETGLLEVTTDDDRHVVADALGQLGRGEIVRWESEVEQAGAHGRPIPVSLAIAALSDHSTEPVLLVQVTDISARKRLDAMRDALVAVRQVIVTANSWDQGAAAVLGSLCAHLDWDIAQYWSVDVEKHSLHLRNSWRGDDSNVGELDDPARNLSIEAGGGLVGRVWQSGIAAALDDLTANDYPRSPSLLSAAERPSESSSSSVAKSGTSRTTSWRCCRSRASRSDSSFIARRRRRLCSEAKLIIARFMSGLRSGSRESAVPASSSKATRLCCTCSSTTWRPCARRPGPTYCVRTTSPRAGRGWRRCLQESRTSGASRCAPPRAVAAGCGCS